jgi:23S rRNA (pseudouridine1915-N3)-methyltransferase
MRLNLLCVGRGARTPEQELCDAYLARAAALGPKLGCPKFDSTVVETSRAAQAPARQAEEAERLLRSAPPGAHLIALDEGGRSPTSDEFARQLARLRDRGIRDAGFVIGGPDGLAASLRDTAAEKLAFGPQTWPHLLVRGMLAEQIYRAMTILAGHPYHRGRSA